MRLFGNDFLIALCYSIQCFYLLLSIFQYLFFSPDQLHQWVLLLCCIGFRKSVDEGRLQKKYLVIWHRLTLIFGPQTTEQKGFRGKQQAGPFAVYAWTLTELAFMFFYVFSNEWLHVFFVLGLPVCVWWRDCISC